MAETPYIFNIQKFSTHDGDGVRTTIFFKGCPLHCMWCHNPESQHYYKELIFHRHKCTACGRCVAKCKQGANSIVDGKIVFKAESDALIVKGIIALLIKVLSDHTPDEILNADLYFIDKIGLKEHLSPTRSNGLLSMVKQIRMYALAFKAKEGK